MQTLEFVVPGPPVAWHRRNTRNGRSFKDAADVEYQDTVARHAFAAAGPGWDRTGDWMLSCEFHVHDLQRRDVDNLLKNVMDALTQQVYLDDSQVTDLGRMKRRLDRDDPRTVIRLERPPVDD